MELRAEKDKVAKENNSCWTKCLFHLKRFIDPDFKNVELSGVSLVSKHPGAVKDGLQLLNTPNVHYSSHDVRFIHECLPSLTQIVF